MPFVKDYIPASAVINLCLVFKHYRGSLFLLVLFIHCSLLPFSQPADLKFAHLTTDQGLSQSWITAIVQDSLGFIWFSTENGLNKYSGREISIYKFDVTDTTSLRNNGIWAMLIDSYGRFWLGTATGLDFFDQKNNVFIHYKAFSVEGKVSTENVRTIYEDKSGNIWIGTYSGIASVDQRSHSYTVHQLAPDTQFRVSSIIEDHFGNFWVGSLSHGLFQFDSNKNMLIPHPIRHKNKTGAVPNRVSDQFDMPQSEMVTQLYNDSHGDLWVATNDGLNRYDSASNSFMLYTHSDRNSNTLSDATVHDLREDQEGNLWIGHSKGVSILDKTRKQFTHHHYSIDNPAGLNNNYITSIYRDRLGNMWLGTRNCGVNILYSISNNFKLYAHQPNNAKSLSNNIVKAIVKDKKGRLWLGTDGGGLNLLQKDGTFISYRHNPKDPKSLPNDLILALYEDKQENFWVSTFQGALSLMDRNKGTFEHFFAGPQDPSKLSSASVSVIYEDSKQNLWVGTWYGGLHLLDRKTRKFKRYPYHTTDDTGLNSEKVIDIYEDHKGNLLIATGNDLDVLDPVTGKFKHYIHNDTIKTSISNSGCNSICQDHAGRIWIGTNYGLNLFYPEGSIFQSFGSRALQTATIQGILSDDNGNLWISSQNGIYKYNPETKEEKNYSTSEGLQGKEYITHSYFESADGEMFFGGTNGATAIDPKLMKINRQIPPVVITDLKVFYKSVKAGGPDGLLTHAISYTDEITLSYRDYIFSIEFVALNYNSQNTQYAYKLEGFDENWNYIGNQHIVTFTGLNPGEYTFRVKGSNSDGIWNEKGAALKIKITPHFSETTWFRMIIGAVALCVIFLIFYIRIRIIKKQKLVLETQVVERTKEIMLQKEEIQTQRDDIERQLEEITSQNDQIIRQNYVLDEVRKEVKEKNNQLEEYNIKLENTVKLRTRQLLKTNNELDQFVYRSAHDLKGPISRIMGLCYLGMLENRDKKTHDLLKLMEESSGEMSEKLSRLMNIHTINKKEVTLEPVCYEEIVNDIIGKVVLERQASDVKFIVQVEDSKYESDKDLLSLILKNVIENAVKFRDRQKPECYVKIEVSKKKEATRILISDNGLGIPAGQAKYVFDMFVVCHESIKGFGLGLYEAKLIVRKLNGSIKLSHPENGDTEFRIVLHKDKEGDWPYREESGHK